MTHRQGLAGSEKFTRRLSDLQFRLANAERLLSGPVAAEFRGASAQWVSEFQSVLEELRVAQQELVQQTRALDETREALEVQRERYQDLFEFAPDAYLVTDGNGRIHEANRAAGLMFNIAPRFLIGKPLATFIDEDQSREFRLKLSKLGNVDRSVEWTLHVHPRGAASFMAAATVAAIQDGEGRVIRIRWMIRDITERLHDQQRTQSLAAELECRVEQRTAELEAANQAKDRFLAMLSHELRTPLNPVLTATSVLATRADLPPEMREVVEMIRRNIDLEARLIDDMLDLTRLSRGKLHLVIETVDLHKVIDDALRICAEDISAKNLALDLRLQAVEHYVRADAARLEQVIWNLVKNAAKFTGPGGRISVSTESSESDVRVIISDTGAGIAPDDLSRIFNAFEQSSLKNTPVPTTGLGLGLTLAKAIVDAHEGAIAADSAGPGRGATFTITLPTAARPAAKSAAYPPMEEQPATAGLRILLVDDHTDTLRVMTRLLECHGHVVSPAASVAGALQLAAAHEFDLVISDIGLPDGSGHDLLRRLGGAGRRIKGIALSGYGTEEDIRRSQAAGFIAHLVKPINLEQLQSTIAIAAQ